MVLPMLTMISPWPSNHMADPVKVARQQTTPERSGTFRNLPTSTHRNSPEPSEPCLRKLHQQRLQPSGTCLRNLHQQTPERCKTFRHLRRKFPELASGTYTSTRRNSPEPSGTLRNPATFRNQPFGTFRNLLPPEPTPAYTRTLRNLAGTCLRNLHHFTPELSGTFRNLPPEPTPAYAGTFRNLPPEPAPATRTGTHRSLSGLKTPLAYAVGEKCIPLPGSWINVWQKNCLLPWISLSLNQHGTRNKQTVAYLHRHVFLGMCSCRVGWHPCHHKSCHSMGTTHSDIGFDFFPNA